MLLQEHKRRKREGHDHEHEGHDHDHEEHGHDKNYLLKMSALMVAVYLFYIFEFVAHWGLSKNRVSVEYHHNCEVASFVN